MCSETGVSRRRTWLCVLLLYDGRKVRFGAQSVFFFAALWHAVEISMSTAVRFCDCVCVNISQEVYLVFLDGKLVQALLSSFFQGIFFTAALRYFCRKNSQLEKEGLCLLACRGHKSRSLYSALRENTQHPLLLSVMFDLVFTTCSGACRAVQSSPTIFL